MSSGTLSGIVTAVLLVTFVSVCVWAYSGRRRAQFDAAARMPLEDAAAMPREDERTESKK